MERNIELKEESEQQNFFLDIFDSNILAAIFIELTISNTEEEEESEGEEKQEDYKNCFTNCISFSLTSKRFNSITKQIHFSMFIFQEKIENLNFNIYLKLNYILEQNFITNEIHNEKQKLLNNILIYTSKNGIYDLIPILISNGANVDCKYNASIPLCQSCGRGYYKTSKILIKYNSNINFKSTTGESILLIACRGANLKLVKYLIKIGLNINDTNDFKENILFHSCFSGNVELVKYLIKEKKSSFKEPNSSFVLFAASSSGNLNLLKYLIDEKKLDFKICNNRNENILFRACWSGNLEVIKYLIDEKKLNFNSVNNLNENILFDSAWSGNLELLKYLIDDKKLNFNSVNKLKENILFRASWSGNIEVLKYLINEKKLNMFHKNRDNRTILFNAVTSKNMKLIDYLISLGLDINDIDRMDYTVLYSCCCFIGNLQIMKHLILKGNRNIILNEPQKMIF